MQYYYGQTPKIGDRVINVNHEDMNSVEIVIFVNKNGTLNIKSANNVDPSNFILLESKQGDTLLTERFHKQADYIINLEAKIKSIEKKTIATILAYVEKNHDAPEIEEYLWKLLDEGTEFE